MQKITKKMHTTHAEHTRQIFRKLKLVDFRILSVFWRDRITNADRISKELGGKVYTTYNRRVRRLAKFGFLKNEGTESEKGEPRFYSLTFKGILAILCNENINPVDVMERTKEVFQNEPDNYLQLTSPQILGPLWQSTVEHWLETQAKTRVDLSLTPNTNIIHSFAQTILIGVPEVIKTINPTTLSQLASVFSKITPPRLETYAIGYCELGLRMNLPLIDFEKMKKPFAESLYKNMWQDARSILERTIREKPQLDYWLRGCVHFIQTQNGQQKCHVGTDCDYHQNCLACPKVRESIQQFLISSGKSDFSMA